MRDPGAPVMAHWQFELDGKAGAWQGFSAPVSSSLEAAYQQWAQSPGPPAQVRSGHFVYHVDYASMLADDARESQRIRRISVTESGGGAQLCRVEPALWSEHQRQLEAVEKKLAQREEEAARHAARLTALQEELEELRGRCAAGGGEGADSRLLQRLRGCLCPGQLVTLAAGAADELPAGALGRVLSVEGQAAAVELLGRAVPGKVSWLPLDSLQRAPSQELLRRPGTRVRRGQVADGLPWRRGVVCGAAGESALDVLTAGGERCHVAAAELELDTAHASSRPQQGPAQLQAGDLARVACEAGLAELRRHGIADDDVGMVVGCEDGRAVVRFGTAAAGPAPRRGHVDLSIRLPPGGGVGADGPDALALAASDLVRPGAAVRLREAPELAVGVVYALHGDGTAVADFLGAPGTRCNAARLEVVDAPAASLEYQLACLLGGCLSWCELCGAECGGRGAGAR